MPRKYTPEERLDAFLRRVNRDGPVPVQKPELGSCWIWTSRMGHANYGVWWWSDNGKKRYTDAHRWLYLETIGPIPKGLHLDHICHNGDESCPRGDACMHRRCVRPSHLEPVSRTENLLRAQLGHCRRGHPYDEQNTYIDAGNRRCRTCQREAVRRYVARKKDSAA